MRLILIALAGACLAACNPSAPTGAETAEAPVAANTAFPNLFQASYRAEATITPESGAPMPIVIVRDGHKARMEMTTAQGPVVTVVNGDTGENFVVMHTMGRTMVMRQPLDQLQQTPDEMWAAEMANARVVGACTHMGEVGVEWERPDEDGPQQSCVTADGIMLWATDNGRTTWTTTSVQRGPQDAASFAMPEGAQVMDLGRLGAGAAEAMARAKQANKDQ